MVVFSCWQLGTGKKSLDEPNVVVDKLLFAAIAETRVSTLRFASLLFCCAACALVGASNEHMVQQFGTSTLSSSISE